MFANIFSIIILHFFQVACLFPLHYLDFCVFSLFFHLCSISLPFHYYFFLTYCVWGLLFPVLRKVELFPWKRLNSFFLLFSALLSWEGLGAGGEGDDRGWDGWIASPTWWTWVWVNSGSWWWTGRPGVLQFMGSQRVRHDWATELNWKKELGLSCLFHMSYIPRGIGRKGRPVVLNPGCMLKWPGELQTSLMPGFHTYRW